MFSDLATLTFIHTALSFLALIAGFLVLPGLLGRQAPAFMTPLFLFSAFATSATGFLFPFNSLLPSHITGVVALVVLAVTLFARYYAHLSGAWRAVYAATAVASLYFLVFVLVAQIFAKIPLLHATAPTQSEPPFAIAQLVVLAIFIWLGIAAARRFRPDAANYPGAERAI
jgi:hypothetical protein